MNNINWIRPFRSERRTDLGLVILAAVVSLTLIASAQEGEKPSTTEKPAEQRNKADSSKEKPKTVSKKLSGAELYSMHCNRCHPERYPTERTAAQWKTILLHMRVRANLPAEQSRTILKYLQDNSGR